MDFLIETLFQMKTGVINNLQKSCIDEFVDNNLQSFLTLPCFQLIFFFPFYKEISCLPPPKIKNGTHTFSDIDVFKYREAVIYSCDPTSGPDKFSLIGISVLFCSGHNTWSSKPPECRGNHPSFICKQFYLKVNKVSICISSSYILI